MFVENAHVISAQARVGMSGMTGLDARACLALLSARGMRAEFASLFLPLWGAGMLQAAKDQRSEKDQ